MKKLTLYTLAGLGLVIAVALSAFKPASTQSVSNNSPYIMVEIYEIPSYPDRGVHIHYGGNKREVIPFKGMSEKDHDEAGDITINAINKLVTEGYQIESTSAGLSEAGMITKIFMRKK